MDRLPGVLIKLFEREYELAFGRQSSGVAWLMAVNKASGAVLPLTALDGPSIAANRIDVLDVDNIVPALEAAGIIKREGPSKPSSGFKLCRCEIVHSELVERLVGLDANSNEIKREREEHSR